MKLLATLLPKLRIFSPKTAARPKPQFPNGRSFPLPPRARLVPVPLPALSLLAKDVAPNRSVTCVRSLSKQRLPLELSPLRPLLVRALRPLTSVSADGGCLRHAIRRIPCQGFSAASIGESASTAWSLTFADLLLWPATKSR